MVCLIYFKKIHFLDKYYTENEGLCSQMNECTKTVMQVHFKQDYFKQVHFKQDFQIFF